jgi:DNA-binding NarL/FixJ family response regulator
VGKLPMRILVVDDFEPIRSFVSSLLQREPELQVISAASDGLEAVQKTKELKPDLIVLDIGLPKLNGIEAARRIRKLVPESKILFLSQVSDAYVVHEALSLGVSGYVDKIHAGTELLAAVEAVLQGKQFVSSGLEDRDALREGVKSNIHFQFEFDPKSKILHGKFNGQLTSASIRDYCRTAASLWAATDFRGSAIDLSGVTSVDVTLDAIHELAAASPVDPVASRPRVIVAPNDQIFGLARMFQMTGKATRPNLRVAQNARQVFALLGVTTPHFKPITQA